jgi:hypothetical protein
MNIRQPRESFGDRLSMLAADADVDLAFFGFVFAHGCSFAVLLIVQFTRFF